MLHMLVPRSQLSGAELLASVLERFTPSVAVIERVGSVPHQASSFKLGRGVGV